MKTPKKDAQSWPLMFALTSSVDDWRGMDFFETPPAGERGAEASSQGRKGARAKRKAKKKSRAGRGPAGR